VRPIGSGCSGWASSEAWFRDSHGYGTYVFRVIGPLNTLDYQVTFGAFTWDDDCPGPCVVVTVAATRGGGGGA
jgi:hypothetical protein